MKSSKNFNLMLLLIISIATVAFNACGGDDEKPPKDLTLTDEGVVINGIKWATRNVAAPGHFAETTESFGLFYQWNRNVAWAATGEISGWDNSVPAGTEWEVANDPSPEGWRVATKTEFETLCDAEKVLREWTTQNGVNGYKYTDKATGKSLFLPAAGLRSYSTGVLTVGGSTARYWTATLFDNNSVYALNFGSNTPPNIVTGDRRGGFSIRSVAK
jgi:uncharacterized protein (TIGR02145 family)